MKKSSELKSIYEDMYFGWRLARCLIQAETETHFLDNISEEFKQKLAELKSLSVKMAAKAEETYNKETEGFFD